MHRIQKLRAEPRQSLAYSPMTTTLEFDLRDEVKFHDGTRLNRRGCLPIR